MRCHLRRMTARGRALTPVATGTSLPNENGPVMALLGPPVMSAILSLWNGKRTLSLDAASMAPFAEIEAAGYFRN